MMKNSNQYESCSSVIHMNTSHGRYSLLSMECCEINIEFKLPFKLLHSQ